MSIIAVLSNKVTIRDSRDEHVERSSNEPHPKNMKWRPWLQLCWHCYLTAAQRKNKLIAVDRFLEKQQLIIKITISCDRHTNTEENSRKVHNIDKDEFAVSETMQLIACTCRLTMRSVHLFTILNTFYLVFSSLFFLFVHNNGIATVMDRDIPSLSEMSHSNYNQNENNRKFITFVLLSLVKCSL